MKITFDRIGRHHRVPDLEVPDSTDADEVAEAVHKHARNWLMAADYETTADLNAGTVSIGFGWYGTGTIHTTNEK